MDPNQLPNGSENPTEPPSVPNFGAPAANPSTDPTLLAAAAAASYSYNYTGGSGYGNYQGLPYIPNPYWNTMAPAPAAPPLTLDACKKPRGKPESMAQALAERTKEEFIKELKNEMKQGDGATDSLAKIPAPAPKEKKKAAPKKKKDSGSSTSTKATNVENRLAKAAPHITPEQYVCLEALMKTFCRVPLLSEFSRPVALLHPELMTKYNTIVKHPVDLGHVCRGIRKKRYKALRDVQIDMWLVFCNCVKFHSHPNNKEAVPSFVSIALHLREVFHLLWQEFMLPSTGDSALHDKRAADRKRSQLSSGNVVLAGLIAKKMSRELMRFSEEGKVDILDEFNVLDASFHPDSKEIAANIKKLAERVSNLSSEDQYSLEHYFTSLYQEMIPKPAEGDDGYTEKKSVIDQHLTRLSWKVVLSLHEANSRGVTQSSIWGNIAATIWARESSKKSYWPALCLGILPPADQREVWHDAVTERNESRLPDKIRVGLESAKKRCISAQNRQSLSYFLVEFLGTHEFIWVRETDIEENFDPQKDPNEKGPQGSRKKRPRSANSSGVGSTIYKTAIDECEWANEEYENVLQDALSYTSDNEQDGANQYSYKELSKEDDEADAVNTVYEYDAGSLKTEVLDEVNWLLSNDGYFDSKSIKSARGKPAAPKKSAPSAAKLKAKEKEAKAKARKRELAKEKKEIEKRRKKRMKAREKALADKEKRVQRLQTEVDASFNDDKGLAFNKKARATAIVKGYLMRMSDDEEYTGLTTNTVMNLPAHALESQNLLGMALAFRAVIGDVPMPDATPEEIAKIQPWKAIDVSKLKTSEERVEALKKKQELLKAEIERVKANTQRRKDLARDAISERLIGESEIEADEEIARKNPFKKARKLLVQRMAESTPDTPASAAPAEAPPEVVSNEDMMDVEEENGGTKEDEASMEMESVDATPVPTPVKSEADPMDVDTPQSTTDPSVAETPVDTPST